MQDVSPLSPALRALGEVLGPQGVKPEEWLDPFWRLNNLYWIVTDKGKKIRFRMNLVQVMFYRAIWYLNVILKSRQHGFTTLIDLLILDQCVFRPNISAGIIAHTLEDAGEIFRTKVEGPWNSLPDLVKAANPLVKKNESEMVWANGSRLSVDTSYRSGTLQYLHVSEFGKIGRKYPDRATEIVRGAFEAVHAGQIIFVESTAEGRGGAYYDLVQEAIKTRNERRHLTRLEWRFHFYPWWRKPENRLTDDEWPRVPIPQSYRRYFAEVERLCDIVLEPAQKAWYVLKHTRLKDDGMWQEHPSTEGEPFQVAAQGTYFSKEMAILRQRGQIGRYQVIPGIPVNTFWDWGLNDTAFIWFHQRYNGMDRFTLTYENNGEAFSHYASVMRETGYLVWGKHFFPHDMGHRTTGVSEVKTLEQLANEANIKPSLVVDRVEDKRISIAEVRRVLPGCCFDAEDCERGIQCLDSYSKEWNDKQAVWRDHPRHDEYSNGADAFQQFALCYDLLKGLGPTEVTKASSKQRRRQHDRNWRVA